MVQCSMKLILSLLLPQLAGAIGALFTVKAISTWYVYLNKPSFSPPNWLFGPVWLILYLLMGVAVYLNWTPVFFGAKNLFLALLIIIIIWLLIVAMITKFWRVNKISSLLLIPYLFWVTFATALNYFVWRLN